MVAVVVLAVVLALAATGAAGVAVGQVLRGARRLRSAASDAGARVRPLLEELAAEQATTAAELEAISTRRAGVTRTGPGRWEGRTIGSEP